MSLDARTLPRLDLSAAASAWRVLSAALSWHPPACDGDPRFVSDVLGPADLAELAELCAGCPVFAECAAYAAVVPKTYASGYWAGRARGTAPKAEYGTGRRAKARREREGAA